MKSVTLFRGTAALLFAISVTALVPAGSAAAGSTINQELAAAGAKTTSMSGLKREARKYGFIIGDGQSSCGAAACHCEGAKACKDLIASNKCSSDFHCLPTNEGPACVCTKE